MLGYLPLDIICSSKLKIFPRATLSENRFSEQIMSGNVFALNGGYCLFSSHHKQNAHNSFLSKIQTSLLPLIQTFLTNSTRKSKFQLMMNSVENVHILCGCFVFTVKLQTFDYTFVTVNYNSSLLYTLFLFRVPLYSPS